MNLLVSNAKAENAHDHAFWLKQLRHAGLVANVAEAPDGLLQAELSEADFCWSRAATFRLRRIASSMSCVR